MFGFFSTSSTISSLKGRVGENALGSRKWLGSWDRLSSQTHSVLAYMLLTWVPSSRDTGEREIQGDITHLQKCV